MMRRSTMSTSKALQILGLVSSEITEDTVQERFRELVRKYYPSKGGTAKDGNVEMFKKVVEAKMVILKNIGHAKKMTKKTTEKAEIDWISIFSEVFSSTVYSQYVNTYSNFKEKP